MCRSLSFNILLPLTISLLFSTPVLNGQESEQYLKNVISSLSGKPQKVIHKEINTRRRVDEENVHIEQHHPDNKDVPMLSLTKGELAAIYEDAVSNGHTIALRTPTDNHPVKAVVHELEEASSQDHPVNEHSDDAYYYYYYPVKSFLDHLTFNPEVASNEEFHEVTKVPSTQYHSHTHEHNVHITETKHAADKKKMFHPLFMAISGFIGMATMFILSVFILPKLGIKKRNSNSAKDFALGADVILRAIEGHDCSERIRCELGKAARRANMHDNRFVKLLRRIAPSFIGTQIDKIKKYADNKSKCFAIACKKASPKPKTKKRLH